MKPTFFARRSVLILVIVCFLVPFAFRGARMSAERMKNDVKDWLPSGFAETQQLDWFRKNFIGEQFILISWEGCEQGDQRLELLAQKLRPPTGDETTRFAQVHQLGLRPSTKYANWGGQQEKWLQAEDRRWYFLLPNGALHRWEGTTGMWGALGRLATGKEAAGPQVALFSHRAYDDPWKLADPLFKTVTTGPGLLARLTNDDGAAALSRDEAIQRLGGVLFGPDGKQTCLIVTLSERAKRDLHQTVGRGLLGKPRGRIYTLAEQCGVNEQELRLGGPPVDNVAIDEEGTITLVRLVGLSVILGVGLAYACFRSVRATLLVFSIGGIGAVTSLSLVWWCGATVDAVLMSMPALVYVLGISGAVHIINYYRAAVNEGGYEGAAGKALAHGWKPALFCTVTTAFGLLSLCTSEILPIRKFGFFSAMAMITVLVLLFTYLPAVLHQWPLPLRSLGAASKGPSWLDRRLSRFWHVLGSTIIRHHYLVAAGCVLLTIGVGLGVREMRTSVQLIKMFDSQAKIIQDYRWLETNLGKLVPMELVVRVDPEMMRSTTDEPADDEANATTELYQLSFLERMELTTRIEAVIAERFGAEGSDIVGQTMSAATFAPELPEAGGGFGAFARRGGTNRRLELHRDELLRSDYLRIDDDGSELWRISIRLGAFNDVDYGLFVGRLQSAVEPVVAAYAEREQILRQIVQARQGESPAGARVLLVGASDAEGAVADQTAAFNSTLYDLLTVARLRLASADAAALEKLPPEALQSRFDAVVVLTELPAAMRERAAQLAPLVVDAAPTIPEAGITAAPAATNISAVYTGVVPLVYKAQRTLLEGLVQSTFWSFITITPLLMLVSRSFLGGMVAMIPNVVPVLLIFGSMGWLGIDVDIGSMMSASIALGVAVDDTIHFLTWYRSELFHTGNRREAILAAYQRCATPTFQTALISGLGLSIFAFSTFTPTQRFGYLMLAILAMGMFAELVFFPAILASPLGRVFKPAKHDEMHDEPHDRSETRRGEAHRAPPAPHHEPVAALSSRSNAAHAP